MEDTVEYDFIKFSKHEFTGKTYAYDVVAKDGNVYLGEVKWFSKWRTYAFFPEVDTVYERRCLTHITKFIDKLMLDRKIQKQNDKSNSSVR